MITKSGPFKKSPLQRLVDPARLLTVLFRGLATTVIVEPPIQGSISTFFQHSAGSVRSVGVVAIPGAPLASNPMTARVTALSRGVRGINAGPSGIVLEDSSFISPVVAGRPFMKKIPNPYPGRWRIHEMDQWDKDFIDLVGEGHIIFDKKNRGELRFGAVECDLDCRIEKVGDQERIEFSFVGQDEGDEVFGRGWAVLESGDRLRGRIYFHYGDESGFLAERS